MFSPEQLTSIKSMDLLTYLQRFDPSELIHITGQEYTTKTHDSLKISNGKWHWFSKGVGGRTALDYLIHVKGMQFPDAVQHLLDITNLVASPYPMSQASVDNKSHMSSPRRCYFQLPAAASSNNRIISCLQLRGIGREIILHCIQEGILYESDAGNNAVFVGRDKDGLPRHAMIRSASINSRMKFDAPGSDKRYTFSIQGMSNTLLVFEGPIDALSFATLLLRAGKDWRQDHYLALCGLSTLALEQYLSDHPGIKDISLCLDSDPPGRSATRKMMELYRKLGYTLHDKPPPTGKDYNDHLNYQIGKRQRAAPSSARLSR